MPVKRSLSPIRFKQNIDDCYIDDYKLLLESEFDEERYIGQLGFFRVKNHLELVLLDQYKKSLEPTLKCLEEVQKKSVQELDSIRNEINNNNLDAQRKHVFCV